MLLQTWRLKLINTPANGDKREKKKTKENKENRVVFKTVYKTIAFAREFNSHFPFYFLILMMLTKIITIYIDINGFFLIFFTFNMIHQLMVTYPMSLYMYNAKKPIHLLQLLNLSHHPFFLSFSFSTSIVA